MHIMHVKLTLVLRLSPSLFFCVMSSLKDFGESWGLSTFVTLMKMEWIRSSIGAPEVVMRDVKHTNYFETGEILRSCSLI